MKNKMDSVKKNIAEIIPSIKLPRDVEQFFSYQIPESLKEEIKIGDAVMIPFRRKEILGIVRGFLSEAPKDIKTKDIKKIIKDLGLSAEQIELAEFISKYYCTSLATIIKTMIPWEVKKESRKAIGLYSEYNLPKLETSLSRKVLDFASREKNILFIHSLNAERHRLYQDIMEKCMKTSGQTLLMLPEYFDVWSSAQSYIDIFGRDKVAILCSDITKNQYFQEWQKIKDCTAKIIIGTRQAVFAPLTDLGLVIVDDEHSSSYKQWDQNPRYNGVDVAIKLAEIHGAKIILSSPIPSMESCYRTRDKFVELDISEKPKKNFSMVDFNTERKKGNYSLVSEEMHKALIRQIYKRRQALVFIPRLGEKTMHQCRDCGYIAHCNICQNALISYKNKLYCSRCKELHEPIRECPNCHGQNIGAFGGGSQRIFEEITGLFENKNISIAEMDSMAPGSNKKNQEIIKNFQRGKIDILVGTQMIWKNWNMPNLGFVGVVFPEIIFGLPGFRSKERAWQFLARAYEFARSKEVIIETYKPEHKYFKEFKDGNLKEYFQQEIKSRRSDISKIPYPPIGKIIKLIYKNTDSYACEKEAKWQYKILQDAAFKMQIEDNLEIMPPFSAYSYREYGKYRWHIIVKHRFNLDVETRNTFLGWVKKDWIIDIDPDEIL